MSVARCLLLVLSFASEEGWVAHLRLPPLQSHKARDAPVATAVRHHVKPSALSRLTGGTIAGGREAARADPSVVAMALCMREWKVQGGGAGRLGRSASSCGGGGAATAPAVQSARRCRRAAGSTHGGSGAGGGKLLSRPVSPSLPGSWRCERAASIGGSKAAWREDSSGWAADGLQRATGRGRRVALHRRA